MTARRHTRRITRIIEDLPSLFGSEARDGEVSFTVTAPGRTSQKLVNDEYAVADEFTRPRKELRFMSFGSGSSGNCSYVGTSDCGLLIDAGVDNNFVTRELLHNAIDMSTIKGIFLTHDHADHVRYAYALLRRNPHLRLYATPRVLEGLLRRHSISRRIKEYHSAIYKEHEYHFDNLCVIPFETSHDGTDNCGFSITMDDTTFVVATDMGYVTERADYYIRQASALMIESDYDDSMLAAGRYPDHLKARIRSNIGHMDNAVTSHYLTEIYTPRLRHVFLCHLSEDNNTPETALATAINSLRTISILPARSAAEIVEGTVFITPLPRYNTSDLYII